MTVALSEKLALDVPAIWRGLTRGQKLYYLAFALSAFTTLMVRTTYESVFGLPKDAFIHVVYAASALLLVAKLALEREASWRFSVGIVLALICCISYWCADLWRFSALFLFIAAGKDVSLRYLAAITLCIQLFVLLPTIFLAYAGRLHSFTVWREGGGVWLPRLSYGYVHPNVLGQTFLTLALCVAVLRFPRFSIPDALVYLACACAAAFLVGARTATVCIVVLALLAAIGPFVMSNPARQSLCTRLALACFVFCALFSLGLMVFYNPDIAWMRTLDQLLSTRFSLAHLFFEQFPPQAFGRAFMLVQVDDFVQSMPDNAYAFAVLKGGMVPALVLGVLVLVAFVQGARQGQWNAGLLGLLIFAISGVMEMYAINFTLNFFLIMCAHLLYGKPKTGGGAHAS